jgi:antitoxin component YwqK of YwqJK toxin-antitoxin module
MRILLFIILLLSVGFNLSAQDLIPLPLQNSCATYGYKLIKQDSAGTLYATFTPGINVLYSKKESAGKRKYKIFRNDEMIEEGSFVRDIAGWNNKNVRDGFITMYYEGGTIKQTAQFDNDHIVGTCHVYSDMGVLIQKSSHTCVGLNSEKYYCLSGSYAAYHDNGKTKEEGLYKIAIDTLADTIIVEDPITGATEMKIYRNPKPHGVKYKTWKYYDTEGLVVKEETFE